MPYQFCKNSHLGGATSQILQANGKALFPAKSVFPRVRTFSFYLLLSACGILSTRYYGVVSCAVDVGRVLKRFPATRGTAAALVRVNCLPLRLGIIRLTVNYIPPLPKRVALFPARDSSSLFLSYVIRRKDAARLFQRNNRLFPGSITKLQFYKIFFANNY